MCDHDRRLLNTVITIYSGGAAQVLNSYEMDVSKLVAHIKNASLSERDKDSIEADLVYSIFSNKGFGISQAYRIGQEDTVGVELWMSCADCKETLGPKKDVRFQTQQWAHKMRLELLAKEMAVAAGRTVFKVEYVVVGYMVAYLIRVTEILMTAN